ncbi:DNA polymerase III delta prime subunit [Sphingomonas naasensis]|uniref:ATP-binding protein n=1 Tax=Sphingomonas naasensis TaxID=1344951 RepID=A0A4S1WJC7_9SPHN|nr:ATP-binding protein [Sphingomonas naasensis]NIJ20914.1 DNA polymerase III delta prime subunit [Sphingomonas naasensis]TGX43304.1 ATP-binding protein [Sphingomonas naasensis]
MTGDGTAIEAEIGWFRRALDRRLDLHANEADGDLLALAPAPPLVAGSAYAEGIADAALSPPERLMLLLALLPHLRPQALDLLLLHNEATGRRFTEFGGVDGGHHGFRPTRETALFLLAGENMDRRLAAARLLAPDASLYKRRILDTAEDQGEIAPWAPLTVSRRWLARLTGSPPACLQATPHFPAQLLQTPYVLDDLVVGRSVREELDALLAWVRNERLLMDDWGLRKHVKPGYRALFHGPPGTGKTMTAAVIGKALDLPVYRVDLSRVVSKWVGETEKNLGSLFDQTAEGDILLFFDEADALFGRRGDTQSANDRHANQQIAYLLQRIEDCPGVVILASNLKGNIDAAFARRFQAMIYFPMPDATARLKLWRMAFAAPRARLAGGVSLEALARRHELSGGEMINVLRRLSVHALIDADDYVPEDRLSEAIARELANSGRVIG